MKALSASPTKWTEAARVRPLRSSHDLIEAGLVDPARAAVIEQVAQKYAVSITAEMAALIDPGDPDDPIARQFVPSEEELHTQKGEIADPIGDEAHSPVKGIVHRYPDRVLLKPLMICPVYCRFCFRREAVGPGGGVLTAEELESALDYIAAHDEIWEVILSGGDPLMLSDRRLAAIIERLDAIDHVGVIRIHTRVPVADPSRVSPATARALRTGTAVYAAIHCNHPREITPEAVAACRLLAESGVVLLGQTVLLKGVNDDSETLTRLMRALVAARIKPYYLHHGDLAPGTSQFRTTIAEGQALMRAMRGRVSGLCQPSYVLDIPGGHGKAPIGPQYLGEADEAGRYGIADFQGNRHGYPPPS